MEWPKYSKMCLCRCLAVFLLVPALVCSAEWKGKWFPEDPHNRIVLTTTQSPAVEKTTEPDIDHWTGKWFPNGPGQEPVDVPHNPHHDTNFTAPMGIVDETCDNGKDHLETDFDPTNISESIIYVCLGDKHLYNPNTTVNPVLYTFDIPPAYHAPHKCMDTVIEYTEKIPTFGTHRPLWAKYGVYKYLPPQRWIHNLEHGAIVVLYHPCAHFSQVEQLKLLVKNCLYRHVISPNSALSPERPMALLAWGKRLEMSVVDPDIVVNFVKENALRGPEKVSRNGHYEELLLKPADIVSTIDDSVLCPNNGEIPII